MITQSAPAGNAGASALTLPQDDEIETCARAIMRAASDDGDDLSRFELCDLVYGVAKRIADARRAERGAA